MKDLKTRVISGLIGGILLIFILMKSGMLLGISLFILSMIGLSEFYRAFENIDIKPMKLIAYFWTIILYLDLVFNMSLDHLSLVGITITSLMGYLFLENGKLEDSGITVLGFLYIPFLLSHLYYLSKGIYIWLVFLIAFGSDTFAYFAGNLFGKRKLTPTISPNKTVEGAIGGIIGSFILTLLFSLKYANQHTLMLLLLAVIGSIVSQSGDLIASKIKRYTGVKDYGHLIPGHGGVMDRFDSIIVTTPLVYYFVKIFL